MMIGFMMLYGLVLSIPSMLLFWLIQRQLKNNLNENKTKLILSVYSFFSVWITFYIFDRGFVERGLQQIFWVVIYSLTIVIGVWIFKLPKLEINDA
jgi:cyanate permease